jgi:ABC-2 type transport system ATP-binding protein
MCDRVALMQNGRIMAIDTPSKIAKSFHRTLLAIRSDNMYRLILDLRLYPLSNSVYPFGHFVHYTSMEEPLQKENILNYLRQKGHNQIEMIEIEPSVEDSFMELMIK